jgi:hypothetical protein
MRAEEKVSSRSIDTESLARGGSEVNENEASLVTSLYRCVPFEETAHALVADDGHRSLQYACVERTTQLQSVGVMRRRAKGWARATIVGLGRAGLGEGVLCLEPYLEHVQRAHHWQVGQSVVSVVGPKPSLGRASWVLEGQDW